MTTPATKKATRKTVPSTEVKKAKVKKAKASAPVARRKRQKPVDAVGITMLVRQAGSLTRFRKIARANGLAQLQVRTVSADGSALEVWTNDARTEAASWIEQPRIDGTFVWVRGIDWEPLSDRFEKELPCRTCVDLEFALATGEWDHDTWVSSLFWIGYMGRRGLPFEIEIFDRALGDPRPTIRLAAIEAWTIHRWPVWESRVVDAARNDADSEVRARAAKVL